MFCPKCGHDDSKVTDSRPKEAGGHIWRRRECLTCKTRWSTREYPDGHSKSDNMDMGELEDALESLRVVHKALGRTLRRIEDIVKCEL